jgi:hypothetical protein
VPIEQIVGMEQRTTPIDEETYDFLSASESFRALVDNNIVSLVISKELPFGLRGGFFVGQAMLENGVRVVMKEKVDGALSALLHWAVPESVRDISLPAPVTPRSESPVFATYARRLLSYSSDYLRHGRLKDYRRESRTGASPRGRINVRETALLRARGKFDRIAFGHRVLSADLLPNQLLAFAFRALDSHFSLETGAEDIVDGARYYAPLFEDVDSLLWERQDWEAKSSAFDDVFADGRVGGDLRKALSYARAFVLNLGPWPDADFMIGAPRAYFLNLHSLFQDAVMQVLRESAKEGSTIHKGAALRKPLFAAQPDMYIADPDFAIGLPLEITLVGDCKYKDLDTGVNEPRPGHGDLYQLESHCSTLRSRRGILLYPGDHPTIETLGVTAEGISLHWARVRPPNLKEDVSAVLDFFAA